MYDYSDEDMNADLEDIVMDYLIQKHMKYFQTYKFTKEQEPHVKDDGEMPLPKQMQDGNVYILTPQAVTKELPAAKQSFHDEVCFDDDIQCIKEGMSRIISKIMPKIEEHLRDYESGGELENQMDKDNLRKIVDEIFGMVVQSIPKLIVLANDYADRCGEMKKKALIKGIIEILTYISLLAKQQGKQSCFSTAFNPLLGYSQCIL